MLSTRCLLLEFPLEMSTGHSLFNQQQPIYVIWVRAWYFLVDLIKPVQCSYMDKGTIEENGGHQWKMLLDKKKWLFTVPSTVAADPIVFPFFSCDKYNCVRSCMINTIVWDHAWFFFRFIKVLNFLISNHICQNKQTNAPSQLNIYIWAPN